MIIPGATGRTHILTADDFGRTIKVGVSYTDGDGFLQGAIYSEATAEVANPTAQEAQSLDDPNTLPAPDDLHSPSSTQDTITLSWFSIRNVGEYKLLRKKDGTDEWVRVPGSFDDLPSRTSRQLKTT